MPNAPKSAGTAGHGRDVPFEDAVKKLETIVDSMESGDLPLETLLARFEEGTRLIKVCQTKLEEAELKISRLEKELGGDAALKASGLAAEASASGAE